MVFNSNFLCLELRGLLKKVSLITLYTIYALDLAGIGIVLVVFAPLLLDPSNTILPSTLSLGKKNVLLGLLFAAYPLTQLFAAPILGELSDRIGRKKPLLFSTLTTAIAYGFSAVAIGLNSYVLLLLSRLLAGLGSGNLTVAQASIADLVETNRLPSAMAVFNIAGGLAWVIAPYAGSVLANPHYISWFSYSIPFTLMGLLFVIATLFLLMSFREEFVPSKKKLDLKSFLHDFQEVLVDQRLRTLLLMAFVSIFAWLLYQTFMPTYLHEHYGFSGVEIGRAFAYFSGFWFLGGLIASQWLLKRFSARQVLFFPMLIVPCAIASYLFLKSPMYMWIVSAIANAAQSIIIGCFYALFATEAHEDQEGKVFGVWNGSLAFSFFATPLLSGGLSNIHLMLSFLLAAILAFLLLVWFKRFKWDA